MRIKYVYLMLAILGIVLTYSQLIPFMDANGADMVLLFSELFRNEATSFFGFDLLVTAVAGLVFMIADGLKNKVRYMWISVAGVFAVGIAFGFPFYLYLRENQKEKRRKIS